MAWFQRLVFSDPKNYSSGERCCLLERGALKFSNEPSLDQIAQDLPIFLGAFRKEHPKWSGYPDPSRKAVKPAISVGRRETEKIPVRRLPTSPGAAREGPRKKSRRVRLDQATIKEAGKAGG